MNTQVGYHRRRLADTAAALRQARTQTRGGQGPRARLAQHQQQRLETVVRHAATHSPFYRRWLAETGPLGESPVELQRLPVLDKSLLMGHFDELVCDPRLRRDELLDWVGQLTRDQLHLDRYRVALTSGSSGRPGLFVYDPVGWRSIGAQFVRSSTWAGLRTSLPRQRLAFLGGAAPSHITRQGAATLAIGLHRVLALPVTLPLPQLVEALNQFQPTYLNVYPSVAMWLADEQQAGRLRLSPQMLVTAAELRTPEMTQRLVDAFGVRPFDVYGCTEGLFGSECQHHQGIHLFEDTTLVENLDPDGQPVPAGQPGAPTAGHQPAQPGPATAPAGSDGPGHPRPRPLPMRAHLGPGQHHPRPQRRHRLPSHPRWRPGRRPPLHFALLTRDPQVREFQVVQDSPVLRILIVASHAAAADNDELETRLGQAVTQQLLGLGVHDPQVTVEGRHQLARSAGGKLKLVIADPNARPARTHAH